ncbi:STI1-like protein, partial [Durusdinium trenchii]
MAWALSQVLVVGTGGFGYERDSELWINYYDILVRKAFGNYLDLLKEVTFSPLMAEYLSFLRNSAYDHDQNYPDENYAREVMQLFTIGTVKLNLDGSQALDGNGNPIPTYNNEDIMTLARVFTGLDLELPRANVEEVRSSSGTNRIDPTQMIERWHDSYPKQDLDKNYLGDGLPLCSELPKRSFLMQGARYEFLQSYSENSLQIDASSALYKALCGSESGVCAFKPLVLLEQDLACSGNECNSTWPHVVELTGQGALYEYVPPPCMHFYFFEGRIATGGGDRRFWESRRVCANPATRSGGSYCCAGCSNIEPSWFANQNRTCDTQRAGVFQDSCKNDGWWVRNRFCEKRCFAEGQGYDVDCSADGSYREDHVCGFDLELAPLPLAEQNCEEIGMKICDRMTETSKCGYNSEVARVWTTEPCSVNISVHVDGKVASHHSDKSAVNQITVNWYNGPPDVKNCPDGCTSLAESCWCPTRIEIQAVFDRLPTPSELSELKVGAFTPQSSCSVCGEVNAFF